MHNKYGMNILNPYDQKKMEDNKKQTNKKKKQTKKAHKNHKCEWITCTSFLFLLKIITSSKIWS